MIHIILGQRKSLFCKAVYLRSVSKEMILLK